MSDTVFPMGFWNYSPMHAYGPEEAQVWADCGMTLTMSPEYHGGTAGKGDMLALLDACAERNIRLILCDGRTRWGGASSDPDGYRARFLEAYGDFGAHPAAFGFHVGDEPANEALADAAAAFRIQRACAPELQPFINHLPYWKGMEQTHLNAPSFDVWADRFAQDSGLDLFCYDHYLQMWSGERQEKGLHAYFDNLRKYQAAAARHNARLWTTLLSVGHFHYRCPSEDDLRWQLHTAVASGCVGILWFFFYMRAPHDNYRVSPIDEHGEKTETYHRLSRVVRTFHKLFGAAAAGLTAHTCFHVYKAYGGYPLFEADAHPLVHTVENREETPLLISVSRGANGAPYLAVVNNSLTESAEVFTTLAPSVRAAHQSAWNGAEAAHPRPENGAIRLRTWLAPGQMELFRLEL